MVSRHPPKAVPKNQGSEEVQSAFGFLPLEEESCAGFPPAQAGRAARAGSPGSREPPARGSSTSEECDFLGICLESSV